jgi:large subunit ribosomal protein L20
MGLMKKADIQLNRKMLAQLAVLDPASFGKVVELASQPRG